MNPNAALCAAAAEGDMDSVRLLLDEGVNMDCRDHYGNTPLLLAACHGHPDAARVLIERGADLDVTAKYGLSALMLAIIRGHTEVARALIKAGSRLDIRGTGAVGFAGKTAVDLAEERQDAEVVRLLRGHEAKGRTSNE